MEWKNISRFLFVFGLPLLLIPVIFVPLDMVTMILWGPAIIALAISVFSLGRKGYEAVLNMGRSLPHGLELEAFRPAMVIVIVLAAFFLQSLAREAADDFGKVIAAKIQKECQAKGVCPPIIEGWQKVEGAEGTAITLYGAYGIQYPIRYLSIDKGARFQVAVRHNIDVQFVIEGGVGKDLVFSRTE